VTDVLADWTADDSLVVITVTLEQTDPPSGSAGLEGGERVAFVGWLGLLRALSELLARAPG
jgi:hypothetical protein